MENIAIVTDTTSDIPEELSANLQIEIVPLYIGYEGNMYLDGKEINNLQVYEKLKSGIKVYTSAPSIGDFIKVYSELIESKKKTLIYSLHPSSRLSSTFNVAYRASQHFPETRIKVIDSKTAAINLGFIALEAARAAAVSASEERIDSLIDFMIKNNRLVATIESFEYLFMGGRAPGLKKFLARSLVLKPILSLENGKVILKKFVKNKKNSIIEIHRQIRHGSFNTEKKKIGIFYGSDIAPALELEEMLRNDPQIKIDELILTEITTIMSAHTGPGIWGISSCYINELNDREKH